MKIGLVLDDTLDRTDGVQQYVILLGNWLTKAGHDVHYLVGQTIRKDIPQIHSLTRNINVRFNKNRMSIPLPADKNQLQQLLVKENFDVLHLQMPYSPQFAGRLIKLVPSQTRIVSTFHILPFSKLVKFGTTSLAAMSKKSLARIDSFICVSQPAKIFMEQTYKVSGNIIPNAVSLKQFSSKSKNEPKTILFLGRLVHRKGAEQLLRAFALVPDKQTKLIIGGTGPLEKKLKALTAEFNLNNRVEFVGFVPESDKPKFLSQALLAVFPSLGGESFGIVLLEAMAAGAGVVLAGNNPGYASVIVDDRALFDPKNVQQIADKITSVLNNQKLSEQLHKEQSDLVKRYDIEKIGPQIESVYHSALKT